jgi:hypothetical protein
MIRFVVATAMALCAIHADAAGGWYLITPPTSFKQRFVNYQAPLSHWDISHAFDTASECEIRRKTEIDDSTERERKYNLLTEAQKEAAEESVDTSMKMPPGTARWANTAINAAWDTAAQCVASDDPRLAH